MNESSPEPKPTDIARLEVPAVVDLEVIRTQLGPSIDKLIVRADSTVAKLAAGIKDDETMALAVGEAELLRDSGKDLLERWREDYYIPQYREAERTREVFDPRLKRITAHIKTLMAHVSDYKGSKEREAKLARERAEAEARRQREEAERKVREAEEAERRAKEAAEAEKRRAQAAKEAEERRIQAEKEAAERREREAREAAAAETARKLKEEEEARIKHAEVAQEEGNGAAKVDTILESATPISPVLGKAEQARSQEAVALEQENARKVAEEKARQETKAAATAEQKRKDAEAEAFRLRQEAEAATAAATAAAAAAAATETAMSVDSGTQDATRWKWDLASDGTEMGDITAVMHVLAEIIAGRAPIEYCGFERKHPERWRPAQIQEDVTAKKDRFVCAGIIAYPQKDTQLKRRVVGGRK